MDYLQRLVPKAHDGTRLHVPVGRSGFRASLLVGVEPVE
jgi:hypothetical protein